MSIKELIQHLADLVHLDPEYAHREADRLLLDYIGDPRVREAFEQVSKWYAR